MEGLVEAIMTVKNGGKVVTHNQACYAALVMNLSMQGVPFYQANGISNGVLYYGVSALEK